MAMLGVNGGLIGKRRRPLISAASGIWSLNEQANDRREASWPTAGFRYWRFANFADTALNNDTIDMTEIELYSSGVKITGITATSNIVWTSGVPSSLVDGVKASTNRTRAGTWTTKRATAILDFDLGAVFGVDALEIFTLFTQPRFPASFDLQFSSDGITYGTYATVTVGTSFTDLGDSVFTSGRVTV